MTREEKVKQIKKLIKLKKYDLKKAIEGAADKIIANPESLLWK